MRLSIPGRGTYELDHLALDMNGTIAADGELLEGVAERLQALTESLRPVLLTADTHGGAVRMGDILGLEVIILEPGDEAEQKLEVVRRLGSERTVAIGNGANDELMLRESALGICVVGAEGASIAALLASDVVVTHIRDAFELLLKPRRVLATLRR